MARRALSSVLRVSEEVAAALAARKPVVALESTIISHGMPYPQNLQAALEVESIVRQHNAVPATVALLDGRVHVGLDRTVLETLASAKNVRKTSRRDMAAVIASRVIGATTVSGTLIAAHAAGIPLFVTGGLGGVHRGAAETMDISADITELGRTPVAVVCAGVKSILDIGLTLEALETQGVSVVTVGKDTEFPAFFSPRSGFHSTDAIPSVEDCARLLQANQDLQLGSGMVFAVPVPQEHAYQAAEIEAHVQQALQDAQAARIAGKDVTPFVLSRVNKLSKGKSLETNIALVKNNAAIGAQIASAHARLAAEQRAQLFASAPTPKPPRVAVVGGVVLDTTAKLQDRLEMCTTNYARFSQSLGGVGRNIAECLHRLGAAPLLFSCVGADPFGTVVTSTMQEMGMDTSQVQALADVRTAAYTAVLRSEGELEVAVGDMEAFERLDARFVEKHGPRLDTAAFICVDGNVTLEGLRALTARARDRRIPVWMDTTSTAKAQRALDPFVLPNLSFISPNIPEMKAIAERVLSQQFALETVTEVRECVAQVSLALRRRHGTVPFFLVKMGPLGVLAQRFPGIASVTYGPMSSSANEWVHFPVRQPGQQPLQIVSVTGSGDSFCGGVVAALLRGHAFADCVRAGLVAARHSLRSPLPVGPTLTPICIDVAHLDDPAPGERAW